MRHPRISRRRIEQRLVRLPAVHGLLHRVVDLHCVTRLVRYSPRAVTSLRLTMSARGAGHFNLRLSQRLQG